MGGRPPVDEKPLLELWNLEDLRHALSSSFPG
jgi:hypothetical protein